MSISIVGGLEDILSAMEARCPAVAGHCRRVSLYSVRLATQYGLAQETVEAIRVGALLHDLGKLEVPLRLLEKPGRLTEREWARLRRHPESGLALVDRLGFDASVAEIVLFHHERFDGSGYPDSLAGSSIPWPVRIVSVMDAFDALTSPRAYREALSIDAARSLLAREAGSRYCPWVVSGLLSLPGPMLRAVTTTPAAGCCPDGCPSPAALLQATQAWRRDTALSDHGYLSATA
ncbi:MAG TPA: HD domain-containing phosphohydrolase [Vicinamibacterales bacterium]|nr:HD domain-containing phosphohydrolase [Vicinamibacterales bacterium]